MKAIIAGGTGLTGRALLSELLQDTRVTELTAVLRSIPEDLRSIHNEKLKLIEVNFARLQEQLGDQKFDVGFCCLGTTMKIAGSKENFSKVDYSYVLEFARLCKLSGVSHFLVISAAGTNENSKLFYLRVKGEMERDLLKMKFKEISILRPGLIIGTRQQRRTTERLSQLILPLLDPIFVGPFKSFRTIHHLVLAETLRKLAFRETVKGNLEIIRQYS